MTAVFWPATLAEAAELRTSGRRPAQWAYAATPDLAAARGLAPDDEEGQAFAAQTLASVHALAFGEGPRVVVAVEADPAPETGLGAVNVDLEWRRVLAVFADEPEAADDVARARAALAHLDPAVRLESALASEEIAALLEAHPLLWYLPDELDDISAG